LNTYLLEWNGFTHNIVAETASKARYQYWTIIHDCYDISFGGFLKRVTCKLLNKFHYKDLFTSNIEDFKDTLSRRGIEFAHLGMRVEVNGKPGVIVGSNRSLNLDVCFDGQHWKENCHPWWMIKYFDNYGNLVKEYTK